MFRRPHLDCFDKVSIVPCIDFSWPLDQWCIGKNVPDLRQQRAIGALVQAGCENGGHVVQLGGSSQRKDIVAELNCRQQQNSTMQTTWSVAHGACMLIPGHLLLVLTQFGNCEKSENDPELGSKCKGTVRKSTV